MRLLLGDVTVFIICYLSLSGLESRLFGMCEAAKTDPSVFIVPLGLRVISGKYGRPIASQRVRQGFTITLTYNFTQSNAHTCEFSHTENKNGIYFFTQGELIIIVLYTLLPCHSYSDGFPSSGIHTFEQGLT